MKKRTTTLLLAAILAVTISNSSAQVIYTIAGTGTPGYNGDNISASGAQIFYPTGVAKDTAGNLYISDQVNHRIRKLAPSGLITTVAGTGVAGFSGDGGPAVNAKLNGPYDIFVDTPGNLYIADQGNKRIRKVNTAGIISTIAGTGTAGYNGDGIAATAAQLNNAYAVAADNAGNVYISDVSNYRLRKINTSGIISTYAGTGVAGFSGDGGPSTAAQVAGTGKMCFDAAGNLIVIDVGNNIVRKITTGGTITTIAGSGSTTFGGDGGPATSAGLNNPLGIAIDTAGNLYISDYSHYRIRKVNTLGTISTIAGTGTSGFSGDGGAPISAMMIPQGLAIDKSNNLIITDINNHRIRRIVNPCVAPGPPTSTTAAAALDKCYGQSTTLSVLDPGLITWYALPAGGSVLGTGFNYITPALYADTVFYAEAKTCTTGTSRRAFPVTVKPNPVVNSSNDTTVCNGTSVILNGSGAASYAWSGGITNGIAFSPSATSTYTVTGTAVNGCTATATTIVSVITPDPTFADAGTMLTANSNTGTYQWYNCNTASIIPGETSQVFTATAGGDYALIIDESGCVDTSSCFNITFTGIQAGSAEIFEMYPNPAFAGEKIRISKAGNMHLKIYDIAGKLVAENEMQNEIILPELGPGMYFVNVLQDNTSCIRKLIIR
jgi:sugar lactone lactonase YvrE